MVSTSDVGKSEDRVVTRPVPSRPSMPPEAVAAATPNPARNDADNEHVGRKDEKIFVSQGLLNDLIEYGEAIDVNTGKRVVGDVQEDGTVKNVRHEAAEKIDLSKKK